MRAHKGKSGTPSFSMRYNAEDDELEQLIEPVPSDDTSTEDSRDTVSEIQDTKKLKDSPVLSKVIKRSSSLDDPPGETWKFFTDIKGRITKTVEEKIEEIKSDRMKKREKKKLTTGGENSSVSDSEEKSEASTSQAVSAGASLAASTSQAVSAGASLAASTSHAASAKESEEDDELTEMDVSDSTPVRELGPSFDKPRPRNKKRGSIEVAEEALEDEAVILPGQEPVIRKFHVEQVASHDEVPPARQAYSLLRKHWAVVLPLVLALLMAYTPLPREILWACLGGLVVMEFRQVSDWLNFRSTGDPTNPEENCLFTGSFHFDSFHILPDQMRQLPSGDPQTTHHQGWLNEYQSEYSEDSYKLRDTMCIWTSLKGSLLTVSIPVRPPPHRAFWAEPQHPRAFTHHRLYNLTNCKVTLLPEGLTNKRVWSKKYPIHIQLNEGSYLGSSYRDPVEKDSSRVKSLDTSQLYDADIAAEALDVDKKESPIHKGSTKKVAIVVDGIDSGELSDNEEDINLDKTNVGSTSDEPEYSDFVHVSPTLVEKKLFLCLFARSDREKEIWFRRLVASVGYSSSCVLTDDLPSVTISDNIQTLKGCREKLSKSYLDFMYNLAQAMPKPARRRRKRSKDGYSGSMWFNVFVSRIYYDFINNPVCMSILQEKVQRKLSTVKLPGIVEELVVSRLVVEGPGPIVDGWTEPRLDSSGVWADIDISYQGLTSITIDIHINLTGKKKDSLPPSPQKGGEEKRSAVFNSSVEDSGESSTDSDDRLDSTLPVSKKQTNSPSVVNRITHKYFNQVAESKLVKKALEGVSSNTHISLIVEVKALVGTLVINIPPPPTNRMWYGFRPKPKLCLRARPVLGETVVSLVNISNWIEKKLYREFEKVLVLPNMDDVVIPLMDRNIPF